jgi:hypothetical protein
MIDIYNYLKTHALNWLKESGYTEYPIRGLWEIKLTFRPDLDERMFNFNVILVQTVGQGCSYCDSPFRNANENIVGTDSIKILNQRNCLSIATLDSIYSSMPRFPVKTYQFEGNSKDKAQYRAKIILDEAELLLRNIRGNKPKVVNVGAVGLLIKGLKERDYLTYATDFDQTLIGQTMHGVTIESGTLSPKYVKECDLAIITGMTLSTNTLEEIIDVARESGTKLLIFAETGAYFGEAYCELGVDTVVSEPFPFYIFEGVSKIEIYRKK